MAVAVLIHFVVSTLAAMTLGVIFGRMNAAIAFASLGVGVLAGVWTWWRFKDDRLFSGVKFIPALFYSFIIFAGLQHFLYLLYYDHNGLRTLHPNNFGDLSMHIQYIRNMAGGSRFWPDDPEFSGTLFRYPIGIDLYNALWESLGVPIDSHLFVVGAVMTVVTVSLLHKWSGWLGVGAFFLNGGLANWRYFQTGRLYDFQNAVAWKSFFLSLWITQRGFLFALPAGVYVLTLVMEALLGERPLRKDEKIACAMIWSALAWFHLHTFFIVTLILCICIVLYKKVRPMLEILIPVVVVGSVFVLFSTDFFSQAKVLHIQWGWTAERENLLRFWVVNLGHWIVLWAIGIVFLVKKRCAVFRPAAAVFFALFFVFTFVMVAPWDWDNIKILLWLYLLISWVLWRIWISRLSWTYALVVGVIIFFSGTIALVSSLPGNNGGVQLYQASEIWESKAALMDLPENAVLASAPDLNHPAMFWGARVAMAYPGHLWSHGIQYKERETQLEGLFKGREDWLSLARDMGVTHIYWGENEKRKYGAFNPPWRHQLKNISRSAKIGVYALQGFR